MSVRRVYTLENVPASVRRAFRSLDEPSTPEQRLFQEVVARAVLDALGHTGLSDADQHNAAVRGARVWLKMADNNDIWFDLAGLDADTLRKPILNMPKDQIYREE